MEGPLIIAAGAGRADVVERLLAPRHMEGKDISQQYLGEALEAAYTGGSVRCVCALWDAGAPEPRLEAMDFEWQCERGEDCRCAHCATKRAALKYWKGVKDRAQRQHLAKMGLLVRWGERV